MNMPSDIIIGMRACSTIIKACCKCYDFKGRAERLRSSKKLFSLTLGLSFFCIWEILFIFLFFFISLRVILTILIYSAILTYYTINVYSNSVWNADHSNVFGGFTHCYYYNNSFSLLPLPSLT